MKPRALRGKQQLVGGITCRGTPENIGIVHAPMLAQLDNLYLTEPPPLAAR
jgi:hypothetical protein